LECGGNVAATLAALEADGQTVSRSTIYNHLKTLDDKHPGWRKAVLSPTKLEKSNGLDFTRIVRKR
jgi:hypothetical protein